MQTWLQTLREHIWPSRPGATRGAVLGDSLAMPIALLLVAIVAGPDLFVYLELSTVLDLLGVALFLFAFAVGFRLLLLSLWQQVRSAFAPEDLVLLATCSAPNPLRVFWVGMIALCALRMCALIAVFLVIPGSLFVQVLSSP